MAKTSKIILINFLFITVLLMAACGFQLRGMVTLPPQLQTVYLRYPPAQNKLGNILHSSLKSIGVKVADDPDQAPITLEILDETTSTVQLTVGTSQDTRDYRATLAASYQLRDNDGQVIYGPRSVSDQTTVTVLSNELIDSSNKLLIAENVMRHNVASRIEMQLTSKEAIAAVNKAVKTSEPKKITKHKRTNKT
jgi:LPS-assembly lipoprotein